MAENGVLVVLIEAAYIIATAEEEDSLDLIIFKDTCVCGTDKLLLL
jgi:hypothetical protein